MNKKIEFEGNVVEIIKTDKGYDIKLNVDKNTDIYINNECVYSEYEDEAYKYIPENLRAFVKEYGYDIGINNSGDIVGSYADMMIGKDFTMYFPKNKTKKVVARFTITDTLETILDIVGDYIPRNMAEKEQEIKNEITKLYNTMINSLKEIGFTLYYSHSMGESFWGWQDLMFDAKEFDAVKFIKAVGIIAKYDDAFTKLVDEYGLKYQ
jgi:hypothetical protein